MLIKIGIQTSFTVVIFFVLTGWINEFEKQRSKEIKYNTTLLVH